MYSSVRKQEKTIQDEDAEKIFGVIWPNLLDIERWLAGWLKDQVPEMDDERRMKMM